MIRRRATMGALAAFVVAAAIVPLVAQQVGRLKAVPAPDNEALPQALEQMIETERAFAARALVVGWKQAFLEYFANDAVGFAAGAAGLAKEQIAKRPDPPKDVQLLWEPRLGDISASGEIGYLTGPVRTIVPSRNNGRPTHSNYFSVWKRQRDGSFKVIMDVGVDTPSAVPYPAGFTRPSYAGRFSRDYDEDTPPLGAADGVLNSALRSNQARAYRGRLAAGARLFRPNVLPIVGERNIARWADTQTAYALSDTRYSEAARSGDLGYTWGTYAMPTVKGRQEGFYVRVWVRDRSGQWKLAADVLQPQQGK
jgi:ketosteroid isomerase-like protein